MAEHEHWIDFARWTPLALVIDLDGTLIPFAPTPDEARPGPEVIRLLNELTESPGLTVSIVSGRPRETLDAFFTGCPQLLLVAEHGGWRRDAGAWQASVDAAAEEVDELVKELEAFARAHPGALVERKTWSAAFHYRAVDEEDWSAVAVEAETRIGAWLRAHPHFEQLQGAAVIEVRPIRMNKGHAIAWLRDRAGPRVRILALGDDITDEDCFAEMAAEDEPIIVGTDRGRATAARWRLEAPEGVSRFLRWLLSVRRGDATSAHLLPTRVYPDAVGDATSVAKYELLVVSNRLPELRSSSPATDSRSRNVGGLVSALEPVLRRQSGVWLGWSGRTTSRADATRFGLDESVEPRLAWVDFPEALHQRYYNGLCNSALWPLLHSFPSRVRLAPEDWEAYCAANDAFAAAATRLVNRDATIWIHDYHLFLLAERMRERGHRGPIGLFLHVPFPSPDLWFILPWADKILAGLMSLDLVAFHTPAYVANFRQCVATLAGTRVGDDAVEYRGRRTSISAFPIGIIPESFSQPASVSTAQEIERLMHAISPTRLILGVDRLDYTKGIPERLAAFARLLEIHPEWRRRVSLVQISVPSRSDVAEYAEQRDRVEQIVGRTNGEFGDADWVPIRYLYRSFGHEQLAQLYRNAAIGYVTPLRDGMNLVAKEYVAAQDPEDPGVLLLSRFAGASYELGDALLTNPWYIDGLALDLDRALRLDLEDRRSRHRKLLETVMRSTALTWAEDFLSALAATARSVEGS